LSQLGLQGVSKQIVLGQIFRTPTIKKKEIEQLQIEVVGYWAAYPTQLDITNQYNKKYIK